MLYRIFDIKLQVHAIQGDPSGATLNDRMAEEYRLLGYMDFAEAEERAAYLKRLPFASISDRSLTLNEWRVWNYHLPRSLTEAEFRRLAQKNGYLIQYVPERVRTEWARLKKHAMFGKLSYDFIILADEKLFEFALFAYYQIPGNMYVAAHWRLAPYMCSGVLPSFSTIMQKAQQNIPGKIEKLERAIMNWWLPLLTIVPAVVGLWLSFTRHSYPLLVITFVALLVGGIGWFFSEQHKNLARKDEIRILNEVLQSIDRIAAEREKESAPIM
jgi:hypothetical protein